MTTRITARELFDQLQERLGLRWIAGQRGERRVLESGEDLQRRPAMAGYLNTTVTPSQQVAKYDTFDLSLGVDVLSRVRLSFDVRNLLNEDPPFVDTTRGYDAQSANPIPRMFSLSAAVKF